MQNWELGIVHGVGTFDRGSSEIQYDCSPEFRRNTTVGEGMSDAACDMRNLET